MKKILLSFGMLVFVGAAVAGATGAFFSDTETSTGNTFTAGEIDLKISNTAFYNETPQTTLNWELGDIGPEALFMDFTDIKPGDRGYNKITAQVLTNDAWGRITLTKGLDQDVTCTGPETKVATGDDPQCEGQASGFVPNPDTNGELDEAIFLFAWIDDNDDGIKQTTEQLLLAANSNQDTGWSSDTPFNPVISPDGVLTAGVEYEATLGWCVGIPDNVVAGNDGATNTVDLQAVEIDLSTCDGATVDNRGQSDTLTADVAFEVEQLRNNPTPFTP